MSSLYKKLTGYAKTDMYPFHMPGHKRVPAKMTDPYTFDITEIDGFDDLHCPEGVLKEAQERAAALYQAEETFFLVNGSTAGILAAVSAVCAGERQKRLKRQERQGGAFRPHLLAARNCHRSIYHALYLNRADVTWIRPGRWEKDLSLGIAGRILPEDVKALLDAPENQDICGIIITSPTYDGVASDVRSIAELAHRKEIPLIVDEAHGAHFGMHPKLPPSSAALGADLVIHSLHKTLPSLTQTALLHVNGPLADRLLVRRFLSVFQTSSPSYVLMASIDSCIELLETQREELFEHWLADLEHFYEECKGLKNVRLCLTDDPGKLLVTADGALSGTQICAMLRDRFHLEPEMAAGNYALCLSSIADSYRGIHEMAELAGGSKIYSDAEGSASGLQRLAEALNIMDREQAKEETVQGKTAKGQTAKGKTAKGQAAGKTGEDDKENREWLHGQKEQEDPETPKRTAELPEAVLPLYEAWELPSESILLKNAAGRISAEFAYLYPPGIPFLIPGERISSQMAEMLCSYVRRGYDLRGTEDRTGQRIRVLDENCINSI